MSLLDYLSKYFPNGPIGSFEDETIEIVEHFFDKFGVNVRIEGNLYLFKYDQLVVKFTIPLTRECRGHIYCFNGTWQCVCQAMDKFWNFDEGYSPVFNENEFNTFLNQIELKTKEDGSLMHLYWLEDKQKWNLSTSGSIVCFNAGDSNVTFDQLFWKTLNTDEATFTANLDKNYTYIFELCSRLNQVVSLYATDRVYFLNARHKIHGTYRVVDEVAQELHLPSPKSVFLYQLDIKTKNDLIMWVENNCKDDADSKNKEGYVGYINGTPSFKLKCSRYKFLHSFKGNNEKETRNNIIDAYFCGTIDDVYNDLHDSSKLFVESLRLKVVSILNDVNSTIHKMKGMEFPTQKDYALFVLANAPKMISSFFFSNKEVILKGDKNINELFSTWLKLGYKKYEDYWKS